MKTPVLATGDPDSPAVSGLRCGSGPGAGRLLPESWEPGKLALRSEGEGLQGRLICGVSRSTYRVLAGGPASILKAEGGVGCSCWRRILTGEIRDRAWQRLGTEVREAVMPWGTGMALVAGGTLTTGAGDFCFLPANSWKKRRHLHSGPGVGSGGWESGGG